MEEISTGTTEPLDVRKIHYLARLMKRFDLSSLDLADGRVQIRLRRRGPEVAALAPASIPQAATVVSPAQYPSIPESSSPPAEATASSARPPEKTVAIESPMVGTYYTSRAPDTPPLVTVGSVVHPGTIVCIIEAMKVFTDIPAGLAGTIVEVLAKNGQAVEYGQALFRVAPA
jgi:acetyl-CoA carboxylase biotin carboxyl carrier protein